MYANTLELQVYGAAKGIHFPIERYGVSIYIDTDPDSIGCDFKIDPDDKAGIELFRQFAAKMAEHYKSLNNKP